MCLGTIPHFKDQEVMAAGNKSKLWNC